MRRRSSTITADSVEEYVDKATKEAQRPTKPTFRPQRTNTKKPSLSRLLKLHSKRYFLTPPSDLGIIDEVEDGRELENTYGPSETSMSTPSSGLKRSPSTVSVMP